MLGLTLFAVATIVAPSQASAQAAGVDIGEWHVTRESDDRCNMLGSMGDHAISIAANAAGGGNFVFFNLDGRLEQVSYPASYSWDAWKTAHPMTLKSLNIDKDRALLATGIRSDFILDLVEAKHLWLRIPGIGFDDDLAIPEAEKLVDALISCIKTIEPPSPQ